MRTSCALILMIAPLVGAAEGVTDLEGQRAIGQWIADRALREAGKNHDSIGQVRTDEGEYRIVSLADLDAPDDVKRALRADFLRDGSGVVRRGPDEIPSQTTLIASLPKTVRSDAVLRGRLPNPPSNLQRTVLATAALIGMEPSGSLDGLKSSGLTRYFDVREVGVVEFNEDNFRTPGALIEAIAEFQNVRVNGQPGQLLMSDDAAGKSRVSLSWAGKDKVYTLTAIGQGDVRHKARVLQEIAAAIND